MLELNSVGTIIASFTAAIILEFINTTLLKDTFIHVSYYYNQKYDISLMTIDVSMAKRIPSTSLYYDSEIFVRGVRVYVFGDYHWTYNDVQYYLKEIYG